MSSEWLEKFTADEWIRAAMAEMRQAEEAYRAKNARAGLAGARRAAGIALNGALRVGPNDAWGRSYVDHLLALGRDPNVPERVREAAKHLMERRCPEEGRIVALRTSSSDEKVLEAAKDVMAHAYAVVKRHEP